MKRTSLIFALFIPLIICQLLTGCMSFNQKLKSGISLSNDKILLIELGKTNFSEILERFGPPDYIIDGTQKILDTEAAFGGGGLSYIYNPIPTRTLISPDGMVILIYKRNEWEIKEKVRAFFYMEITEMHNEVHSDEIFIYISKKDRTVVTVVSGAASINKDRK